ncbi:uncharacterized protein LOC132738184 [Ruditapes philippinarum]|uniref:uncharacterized protein LOC132738184 n=1 Tax=Ruditapes philippinarum TaxID=129788 RepID=UPI00295BC2C3|nr:uncharacterized protein LOC132738184 [Ruditapes philippinarum]
MNSVTNKRAITSTITTDLPQYSENGIRVSILVILIVVSVIMLCSCGIVACYIIKQRRKSKTDNYQQNGPGADNPGFKGEYRRTSSVCHDTKSTRESGAYISFDPISVDMCEINYIHPRNKSETTNQRNSKESTTSGAYMSFDNIDHSSLEL